MKKILLSLSATIFSVTLLAQAPNITWQKSWGTIGDEKVRQILETKDGNFIIDGTTLKLLDSKLNSLWEVAAGTSLDILNNGNLLIGRSNGYLETDKDYNSFGTVTLSSYTSGAASITSLGGSTASKASNNGKLFFNHWSNYDYTRYMDKTLYSVNFYLYDSLNQIKKTYTLGGVPSNVYSMKKIIETKEKEYVIIGGSGGKYFISKLNSNFQKSWGLEYVSGAPTSSLYQVIQCSDGGYVAIGLSSGTSSDGFVIKVNSAGTIVWQKTLGGTREDYFNDIIESSDGGFLIVGTTASSDGNVSQNKGMNDAWLVKIDASGNLLWEKTYGGSKSDYFSSISICKDNGLIVGGRSASSDLDLKSNIGGEDCWIVKFGGDTLVTDSGITLPTITVTPNISTGKFTFSNLDSIVSISIYDYAGLLITTLNVSSNIEEIDISSFRDGVYTYKALVINNSFVEGKIIKKTTNYQSGTEPPLIWEKYQNETSSSTPKKFYAIDNGFLTLEGSSVVFYDYSGNRTVKSTAQPYTSQGAGYPGYSETYLNLSQQPNGDVILLYRYTYQYYQIDWMKYDNTNYTYTFPKNGGSKVKKTISSDSFTTYNQAIAPLTVKVNSKSNGNTVGIATDGLSLKEYSSSNTFVSITSSSKIVDYLLTSKDEVILLINDGSYRIKKYKSDKTLVWSKTYGGAASEAPSKIILNAKGGYTLIGSSSSSDGDVSINYGSKDVWIVELDSLGNLVWDKTFGGTLDDNGLDIALTSEGGYIISGQTFSVDEDFTSGTGTEDAFVYKLDQYGNFEWSIENDSVDVMCIGYDNITSVVPFNVNNYLVAGYYEKTTTSPKYKSIIAVYGDKITSSEKVNVQTSLKAFPNPSSGMFNFSGLQNINNLEIFDITGQLIHQQIVNASNLLVDLSSAGTGVYFYKMLQQDGSVVSGKIVKN